MRRAGRRLVLLVVGLATAGIVLGLVAGLVGGHRDGHTALVTVLGLLAVAPGAVAAIGLLALLLRRPSYRRVMQYGYGRRRDVWKAIKAGRPLTPEDAEVAAAQLDYLDRNHWVRWLPPVTLVFLLVEGVNDHGPLRWAVLVLAGLGAVVLPVGLVQAHRTTQRYRDALSGSR